MKRPEKAAILSLLILSAVSTSAFAQFVNGQPAIGVLGSDDLLTRPAAATTATRFDGPNGVALDPLTGKLFVGDRANHRVLRWASTAALVNGSAAEAVLGQPDFTTGTSGLSATALNNPIGVHVDDAGRLWVGDYGNNRVLRFDDAANKANGAAADGVLGQPDFTTSSAATTAEKMAGPVGISADAAGRLWVSDFNNHRVLRFDDAANKAPGAAADGVLGQPDFTTSVSGLDQDSMSGPNSVCADVAGNLWVSDFGNRRVLRFDDAANKADGAPADGVLGKPDFVTGGDLLTQSGFGATRFVEVGADGRLYVVEQDNNRVMIFENAAALANGAPADYVLGQPDFTTSTAPNPPNASSLAVPRACVVDDVNGFLWVADWANNRVLRHEFIAGSEPAVSLLAPDGGEVWTSGSTYDITWLSLDVTSLDIEYSVDAGATWAAVASGVDASLGAYAWTVPDDPTTQALVRITAVGMPAVTDTSASTFTIATSVSSVAVISPNGLQRWEAGASRKILFEAVNVDDVHIAASDDSGSTWTDIALSVPASSGEFTWTVPTATGDRYLVRVSDAGGSGASDVSDATFAIVPVVTGDEFDYVFFADSPTPDYYETSWSDVTAPSTLVQAGSNLPVSTERSLVGNRALSVAWSSQVGGDWSAAVASIGWEVHDVTRADSLILHVFTDQLTAQADLPCIYLEDASNARSAKIPLATLTGDITAGTWHRLAVPVQAFLDNPGSADMTRVTTILLGQQEADGAAHRWFLDDIRMTGVDVVTGADVPLIVVLGSSTAVGDGASEPDSSWVGRFGAYVKSFNNDAEVVNLAADGYTTYHIREDGYVPPVSRPAPGTDHNITRALAYEPWAIIVNLPSNDVALGYTLQECLENYDAVKAAADAAGVPIWFCTAQPRNFPTQAQRDVLFAQTDSTFARFGSYAIDFWNGVAAADGTILPELGAGDGVHLNDSGHALLYERVVEAGVWSQFTAPLVTNPGLQTNTVLDVVSLQIEASDVEGNTLSYAAVGLPSGLAIDPGTGLISGTVACDAVSDTVEVTVTNDGTPNESTVVSFAWTIDPLAIPAALADLGATQVVSGNDSDGTTTIRLTWTAPADTGTEIAIYRKGFGSYPEYDDDGAAAPTLPLDTWTLVDGNVAASAGEYVDEPPTRDFWYYAAVVANGCGETSGPSNLTTGTLNYHLGDVSDGVTAGQGNNLVNAGDISLLGAFYATVPVDTTNYLDIGPTTDYSVRSRPTTDNIIDFEDLMMFAINFNGVSKSGDGLEPANRNELMVFVPKNPSQDGVLEVSLWLTGDGSLKGVSLPLLWDADVVTPVGFAPGEFAAAQIGQGLVLSPAPGTVDFTVFGAAETGISGEGVLGTVTFEILGEGDADIRVGEIKARDLENKALDLDATVTFGAPEMVDVPLVSELHTNFPNPFNPTTTFKYGVAVAGHVSIDVYDVRGRRVRTLLNEQVRPGTYSVVWDGTDDGGRRVSSGIYLARFRAVDRTQVQRMTLLK